MPKDSESKDGCTHEHTETHSEHTVVDVCDGIPVLEPEDVERCTDCGQMVTDKN